MKKAYCTVCFTPSFLALHSLMCSLKYVKRTYSLGHLCKSDNDYKKAIFFLKKGSALRIYKLFGC